MQKSVTVILVLMGAIGFAALASAQGFMPWTKVMEMADKDKDGMVNPHEVMFFEGRAEAVGFQPFMVDHFQDFDADGDGMVSMAEAKAGLAKLGMTDDKATEAFFKKQGFMPRQEQ